MVMAFYVKLGALFLKQVSKPLASQLKTQATTHPMLRRVVTRLGQKMHEWNVAVSNSINENGRQAFAGKLDDDVALKKAADFIGEVFIFSVAGGIVAYEVNISAKKDAAKSAAQAEKEHRLVTALEDVRVAMESSARRLDSLESRLAAAEAARRGWGLWPWRSTLSPPSGAAATAPLL